MPKFKIEIQDQPAIARIVGTNFKELRKQAAAAAKRKRVVHDHDEAKFDDATNTWVLRLKKATGGRVTANVITVVLLDRLGRPIDGFMRRKRI